MPLLSSFCAASLQLSSPCSVAPTPLSIADLANVHGRAVLQAGLDLAVAAAGARSIDVALNGLRTSDQIRDVFDNWHSMVAVPLIVDAMAHASR